MGLTNPSHVKSIMPVNYDMLISLRNTNQVNQPYEKVITAPRNDSPIILSE
jgi:hypothetical protein